LVADLPIACSLEARGAADRLVEWERLINDALRSQIATATGVELAFSASPEVKRRLEDLVALERECCAFARWTLTRDRAELVLRVDAQADGVAAVQELFRP
jgi:hypothetical protein